MAVDFNGQTNALTYGYLTLGNSGSGSSIITPGSAISVFAFINIAGFPGSLGACIGSVTNMPPGFGGANKQGMFIDSNGFIRARAGGSPEALFAQSANSATPVSLNTWHAAGVSIEQNSIKAYLDGVSGTENTGTWSIGGLEETIIGAYPTATVGTFNRPYTGCIQDLAFWDVALTDEQHAQLTTLSGVDIENYDPPPVLYVRFEDSATAANAILNGVPVTLYFKAYNSNPSDPTATIDTCASSPEEPAEPEDGDCEGEDVADAVPAVTLTWPVCDLVPEDIDVQAVSETSTPGRALSGRQQIVQRAAGHWRFELIGIPVWTEERALQWHEIESKLDGRNGTVLVPFYEAKLSGTPIAATAGGEFVIGDVRLTIAQTAGATIQDGMNFSAGERGYRIKRVLGTAGGETTVIVWPPLRDVITAGETLDFNTPHCRCRLERDDGMGIMLEHLRFGKHTVALLEDV